MVVVVVFLSVEKHSPYTSCWDLVLTYSNGGGGGGGGEGGDERKKVCWTSTLVPTYLLSK